MRVIRALWGSTHPGPTLVVTALSLALGLAAGLEPWRLVLLVVAVFSGQVSVGLSNDAIDAARDEAVGRRDKPIAAGVVSAGGALGVAVGAVVVALVLSAPLGAGMLAAHAVALAAAWAYNAGLKATPFSIVPFVLSFGLFPSFATLSLPGGAPAPAWAGIAGAALGAAVHLTNVLPDLDDDRATGIRGLPHRLGARVSAVVAAAGVVVGALSVLVGSSAGELGDVPVVGWIFFAAAAATAAATGVRVLVRPPDRTVFRLVMLAALLLAAQLVATGGALTA
ncbi:MULTISPECIES: UbiA family prenyltransferase [Microbacterium]|uniref:1,4-dihydroxy-2-naphthoate prenyltransferase n=1 Tax=Microbacterium wangchenii TaxID=2541726 RepID=A0ABX5SW22_9MICO|nr:MULTISPECIES: UbiA family prenyltransferase [Microbacterium]MCK6066094.1 UbiA family prenyltransferase [Microbacterium sp. EYE_512]QBR90376.1 1,4-dihydroxy-2-naphthoate prenyltransferase [Microbacterium wangchenii]TXK11608.1 1,4-dihydroxy-2-naphthoate prenyltransferase [Microbacterium wangchenii]